MCDAKPKPDPNLALSAGLYFYFPLFTLLDSALSFLSLPSLLPHDAAASISQPPPLFQLLLSFPPLMGCPRARNSGLSSSSSDFFASCSMVLLSNIMHAPHKPPNENVSSQSTIKRDLSVVTLWHCCISQPKAFPLPVASLMSPEFRFCSEKYIPFYPYRVVHTSK